MDDTSWVIYCAPDERKKRSSPAAGEFLFEIDSEPLEESLTALGGVPLLLRAARSLDVAGARAAACADQGAGAWI